MKKLFIFIFIFLLSGCSAVSQCSEDAWECGGWEICQSNNLQKRACVKTNDCPNAVNEPLTERSCLWECKDNWQCGAWEECEANGEQKRNCDLIYDCPTDNSLIQQTTKSCQYSNAQIEKKDQDATQIYKLIVDKVSKAPQSRMRASYDSGVAIINLFWEISENMFVVEVSTDTYIGLDESGRRVKVDYSDTFMLRDIDLDAYPDDYWDAAWGMDLAFRKLVPNSEEYSNLIMLWALANSYFTDNLLY